jgi:hypothetical protein
MRPPAHHQARPMHPTFSGGVIDKATPDPISNSEVKLVGADGTAGVALWESRTLPGFFSPRALRRIRATQGFCFFVSAIPNAAADARGGALLALSRTAGHF